jgi:hypothetical protein
VRELGQVRLGLGQVRELVPQSQELALEPLELEQEQDHQGHLRLEAEHTGRSWIHSYKNSQDTYIQ